MTDADDADDELFLAKNIGPSRILMDCMNQATIGIVPNMNTDKRELMCFKVEGAISTSRDKPLKLVD